jgi:site-specific recombinase XerD
MAVTTVSVKSVKTAQRLFQEDYIRENKSLYVDFISYIEDELNYSKETIRSWGYQLNTYRLYLGNTDVRTIRIHDVSLYLRERGKVVKVSSVNTERSILRTFFKYIAHYRAVPLAFDYSMIRNAKEDDPETHFVSADQLNAILPKLRTKQDRLMMLTMFLGAMRISELVRLSAENIRGRELSIKGKGGKKRPIPIPEKLADLLEDYMLDEGIQTGPVFRHCTPKSNLPNQAYTPSGLRKRWARQLEPYGIKIRPHWLRHGGATELHTGGMDIRTLMDFLGHARIETTQRYTHITDDRLREAYDSAAIVGKVNFSNLE